MAGTALVAVISVVAAAAFVYRPSIDPIASVERFLPALVAKGAQLAVVFNCAVCHAGPDGTPYVGAGRRGRSRRMAQSWIVSMQRGATPTTPGPAMTAG
ncbi:MAG: hypothetical protein ACRYF2_03460 [Janthinobacterium lividum]